jgi:hypothetical protein
MNANTALIWEEYNLLGYNVVQYATWIQSCIPEESILRRNRGDSLKYTNTMICIYVHNIFKRLCVGLRYNADIYIHILLSRTII